MLDFQNLCFVKNLMMKAKNFLVLVIRRMVRRSHVDDLYKDRLLLFSLISFNPFRIGKDSFPYQEGREMKK